MRFEVVRGNLGEMLILLASVYRFVCNKYVIHFRHDNGTNPS
jgi:hypothetical protein